MKKSAFKNGDYVLSKKYGWQGRILAEAPDGYRIKWFSEETGWYFTGIHKGSDCQKTKKKINKMPPRYGTRHFAQAVCFSVRALKKAMRDKLRNNSLAFSEVILSDKTGIIYSKYVWNQGEWRASKS